MEHADEHVHKIPHILEKYGVNNETLEAAYREAVWKHVAKGDGPAPSSSLTQHADEAQQVHDHANRAQETSSPAEEPCATKDESESSPMEDAGFPTSLAWEPPKEESDEQSQYNVEYSDTETCDEDESVRSRKRSRPDSTTGSAIDVQREAVQAAEGDIEYQVHEGMEDFTKEHLEWYYGWKHRSYDTYDKGRQVRVKKSPRNTAVKVTQWNWWCKKTTFARNGRGQWQAVEKCVDIKQVTDFAYEQDIVGCVIVVHDGEWQVHGRAYYAM
eukprot:8181737-Lingulodinium_polyedra.AAC.1